MKIKNIIALLAPAYVFASDASMEHDARDLGRIVNFVGDSETRSPLPEEHRAPENMIAQSADGNFVVHLHLNTDLRRELPDACTAISFGVKNPRTMKMHKFTIPKSLLEHDRVEMNSFPYSHEHQGLFQLMYSLKMRHGVETYETPYQKLADYVYGFFHSGDLEYGDNECRVVFPDGSGHDDGFALKVAEFSINGFSPADDETGSEQVLSATIDKCLYDSSLHKTFYQYVYR